MRACLKYLIENKNKEPLNVIEVGVHAGNNAIDFINNLNLNLIYLVDPYLAYVDKDSSCKKWFIYDSIMVDNLRRLAESNLALSPHANRVKFIRLPSLLAVELFPNDSIDFVYIDANHSRPHVDNDIKAWYSIVKKGGVLGGHDWGIQDVQDAVHLFAKENNLKLEEDKFETDWFIIK